MRVVAAMSVKGGSSTLDDARRRPLADHNIKRARFHRRIQNFLNQFVEPVYLVNKKYVSGSEIGENRRQIADFFNCRTGSGAQLTTGFFRDQVRDCCFPQSRRPVKKEVFGRMVSLFRGGKKDGEIVFDVLLTDVFIKSLRTQGLVQKSSSFWGFVGGLDIFILPCYTSTYAIERIILSEIMRVHFRDTLVSGFVRTYSFYPERYSSLFVPYEKFSERIIRLIPATLAHLLLTPHSGKWGQRVMRVAKSSAAKMVGSFLTLHSAVSARKGESAKEHDERCFANGRAGASVPKDQPRAPILQAM